MESNPYKSPLADDDPPGITLERAIFIASFALHFILMVLFFVFPFVIFIQSLLTHNPLMLLLTVPSLIMSYIHRIIAEIAFGLGFDMK